MVSITSSKLISGIILLLSTFTLTFFPSLLFLKLPKIFKNKQNGFKILIGKLNWFAGGVFFAIVFIHMLPETRKNLMILFTPPSNSTSQFTLKLQDFGAEFFTCTGYFLVMFLEIFLNFISETLEKKASNSPKNSIPCDKLLNNLQSHFSKEEKGGGEEAKEDEEKEEENMEENKKNYSSLFLLSALLIHSTLEGLAIGLQPKAIQVWLLLGAILVHKSLISLIIGIRFTQNIFLPFSFSIQRINKDYKKEKKFKFSKIKRNCFIKMFFFSLIFALGSPLGIILALLLSSSQNSTFNLVSPLLQGLASGTFLFICIFEILSPLLKEKKPSYFDSLFSFLGFFIITLLKFFIND